MAGAEFSRGGAVGDKPLPGGAIGAGLLLVTPPSFFAKLVPWLVLFATGVVIWEVYFSAYTTIEQQRIAVLIHSMAAIGAIIVWITHVYAAIWVRGSVRAMTQGYVTRGWAWRHHRKWLRRLVASGSSGPTAGHQR